MHVALHYSYVIVGCTNCQEVSALLKQSTTSGYFILPTPKNFWSLLILLTLENIQDTSKFTNSLKRLEFFNFVNNNSKLLESSNFINSLKLLESLILSTPLNFWSLVFFSTPLNVWKLLIYQKPTSFVNFTNSTKVWRHLILSII